MSTAIALMSGKGGSGKTTLALSIADLLSRCEVQTLLVDCDLSTNGATYFYESLLYERNRDKTHQTFCFADILNLDKTWEKPIPLKIKNNLYFIPSVSEISDQNFRGGAVHYVDDAARPLFRFLNWAREHYGVILFDCQAGYSDFFPVLLPMMDADLFVLEADSISASAMRSLHLKVGGYLGRARLYQVFNKATPEEFEIYSKITGTFFTNIGTLLFDWKIRQAFSRSQLPDIENTSAQYGTDLCNVSKIIFTDELVQKRLNSFSSKLRYWQLENEQEEIKENLDEISGRRFVELQDIFYSLVLSCGIFGVFVLLTMVFADLANTTQSKNENFQTALLLLISICIGASSMFIPLLRSNAFRKSRKERIECEQRLKRIGKELAKLDQELKDEEDKQNEASTLSQFF